MSGRLLLVSLAAGLAVAGAAAAATGPRAGLTATTHTPVAGAAWTWTLTVRDAAGKPAPARARLQVLLGGQVVGCWKAGAMAQCSGTATGDLVRFTGKRTGVIRWPPESAGLPLAFQAVVTAGGKTTRLRYPLSVRAGS